MAKRSVIRSENERERAIQALSTIELPATYYLAPYRGGRSLEQNDMFHGILQVIADYSGHELEEIKELVMSDLGYFQPKEVLGGVILARVSTANMSTDEMSELIERTLAWAAERGLPTLRH